MKDVMAEYKKQVLFKTSFLVILAFLIGFWISSFTNNSWVNTDFLKADLINSKVEIKNSSILEKEKIEKKDFYIEKVEANIYNVVLSKEIKNPLNIGLTFTFEDKKANIEEIKSLSKKFKVIELNKTNWMIIVSLVPKEKIEKFSGEILQLKIKNKAELWDLSFINIINANYYDWKEYYPITTSWIDVF